MESKTETFLGGRLVTVTHMDGSTEEVKVRQLPLGEYDRAFKCLSDEIALTALICGKPQTWLIGTAPEFTDAVAPESYEELQGIAREVNAKGFFSYASRRQEREEKAQERMFGVMAQLPPEAIQAAAQVGADRAHTSPTPSPRPQPTPR